MRLGSRFGVAGLVLTIGLAMSTGVASAAVVDRIDLQPASVDPGGATQVSATFVATASGEEAELSLRLPAGSPLFGKVV